ncbi:MAG: class I SAM-dependent methyltransferase, partial [Acidimicrobiales bacterium]
MQQLLTTSFDRFGRYAHIHQYRQTVFGAGPARILDVGDPYGTLRAVFEGADDTVSVDLFADSGPAAADDPHAQVLGSGTALPFADRSFDLVVSADTLEHVPAPARPAFIAELLRVGAGPVVLVAPFRDPRTEICERLVNSYYVARLGHSLGPLDEHAACGLPDLDWLRAHLDGLGVDHEEAGDGWIYHWLAFMLLKAHN